MKTNDDETTHIQEALSMYKETVSPSRDAFINILNQIPEKEKIEHQRRVIRSPYIWLSVTQYVMLALVILVVSPDILAPYGYGENSFSAIDAQIEVYEEGINDEDARKILINYY